MLWYILVDSRFLDDFGGEILNPATYLQVVHQQKVQVDWEQIHYDTPKGIGTQGLSIFS